MMLVYDETELLKVAGFLLRYNKYFVGCSAEATVAKIKAMAQENFNPDKLGYVSSYGAVVSYYKSSLTGECGAKVSLDTYLFT